MTTLYFLRAPKCSLQSTFELPLCQKGCDQATHAGIELRKTALDAILCSPLPYAVQTAYEIQKLHLSYDPPIEIHPNLISRSTSSPEEVIMSNTEIVLKYILKKFKRKSVLLISHGEMVQGFIANHLGESLATIKARHWSAIERGEIICRQFIET